MPTYPKTVWVFISMHDWGLSTGQRLGQHLFSYDNLTVKLQPFRAPSHK